MVERARIPLFDATVPVACTISNAEIPERVALIERMRAAMVGIDRVEHGFVLRFAHDTSVRSDLETFAVDEKRCCQFWGFEIVESVDAMHFRWEGPPSTAELLDRLHAFFVSGEPVSILDGLL